MEQTLFTAEQIIDAFERWDRRGPQEDATPHDVWAALSARERAERQAEWLVWLMGEVD